MLHLLVFAFSASTALLPCEDAAPGLRDSHHVAVVSEVASEPVAERAAPAHALHHAASTSHQHGAVDGEPAAPSTSHDAHDVACPLVIGCVGMVQWALDVSLRSRELVVGTSVPTGVTLGRVYADRSVDSPPPRA